MNASVLLVGDGNFPSSLVGSVRGFSALTIDSVPSTEEAEAIIQTRPPDLLLLQSSLPDNWKLCRTLKKQRQLAWVYCILLEDRVNFLSVPANGSLVDLVNLTTKALEAGADAYLWLPQKWPDADFSHQEFPTQAAQSRLLEAQVRTGLHRVRSYRELTRANDLLSAIALADPLTQINNRRAFDWELPRQIKNARSKELDLSLMIVDIDYFKTVNDTYGHLVGDQALKMLAERLQYNMRFYDTLFRYGGEEFVILLSNTTSEEAFIIGRRFCQLISEKPFPIESVDLNLTVSIGVSGLLPTDDNQGTNLLHRADQNLLKAKAEGRNRVVLNPAS
ncbi:MAG: diguanylate cyclase [Leptolyngbyaceae cyanobacterium MO_188.B28]|nr:diguanylate cyclase [Leptolyngbyaceae cyanobacterium MO_188.B28]